MGSQLVVGFWQKAETPRTLETTSYQWEAELKSRETSGQIQPFRAQEKKKKNHAVITLEEEISDRLLK